MQITHCSLVLSLAAVTVLSVGPARADWGYTKWGMKAADVIAASGGDAKMTADADKNRDDDNHTEMSVMGTYTEGDVHGDIGFTFDTRTDGLKCVTYNTLGDGVEHLRQKLVERYGKPTESSFMKSRIFKWTTPDSIEMTIGEAPVAAIVEQCAPGSN